MKLLIIAEKPSVARDIANALGKVPKKEDYFENEDYIVAAAQGHLVELVMPEEIDKKYSFWRLDNLPIIPAEFQLKPIERTKSRFQELKKLFSRKDVEVIVNGCDAGREGELIFTYIYQLVKSKKPVKRLWMSSMTPAGIREAYSRLRDGEEMTPLADAARCRSESDWLIGINGTRAVTKRMFGSRGGQAATVGRVQTPTLAIVMERENQIRAFKPRSYYRILADFEITKGVYQGIYQRPDFKKSDDEHDRADRIWDRETAEKILEAVRKLPVAPVTEERKRSQQAAPRLYDLTSLQREANNRYGYPAGRTLQIAQSLYERYKVITYPRTDSRTLPEDYVPVARETLGNLEDDYAGHARKALDNDWVKPNKRIFNNAQVSDHFAIIPTNETSKKLPENEAKIYDMITRRFIAVFYPNAQFDVTTRITSVEEHPFKTEGKVLVEPGWLAVYGKKAADENASTLTPLDPADGDPPKARTVSGELSEEETKPPPRYTEATLLSAMEGAGKLVDDEELALAMKEKGLGTPATRANIIDHLIREKYLERERRDLIPTGKAELLLGFLHEVKAAALTSPSLTGEWEYKLHKIEEGKLSRESFMKEITDLTRDIVDKTKNFEETDENATETSIISPTDGKPMLENARRYKSQDGDLALYKIVGNRKLEETEVQQLLKDRRIGPLDGFRSKKGKPFSAILELDEDNRIRFVFDNAGNGNGEGGKIDFTNLEVIGTCPKCGGKLYESVSAYICENSQNEEKKCDFRVSRKILGRDIERDQMKKLLEQKKTDLLPNFWSKRSKKPFAAHLVLKEKGDIGFEFPPRAAKKTGAKKKTAAKKATAKKAAKKAEEEG